MGCLFLARLSSVIEFIVSGDLPDLFQVSILGFIGYSLFIFSANYGTFDSLADDGSDMLAKYRRRAYLAPAMFLVAALILFFSPAHLSLSIPCAIEVLFLGATSYYDYKHVLIPKHYLGILKSFKPFHILSFIMSICLMAENILWCYDVTFMPAWAIIYIPMCVISLLLMPVLVRGMNRWRA